MPELRALLLEFRKSFRLAKKRKDKEQITGKSLSEALLFAEHGEDMLCTEIVLNVKNNFCTQHVLPMEFSCIK